MKRMLKKLYYGEIYRNEEVLPRGEEFEKVNGRASKLEDELENRLSEAEFKIYDELSSTQNERDTYYYAEIFIEGFKIGARMMMEVLSDE